MTSKKILILAIGLLILIFVYNNNLFRKLYNVVAIQHDERLSLRTGFCSRQSVGYLKYLKKKYSFKFNPVVINYKEFSNSNWPIYDNNYKVDNSHKILLNMPKKVVMIFKPSINLFVTNNTSIHQKGINEILFDLKKNELNFDSEIIIYRKKKSSKNKEIIYKKYFNQIISDNIPISINYKTSKINDLYRNTFIEMPGLDKEEFSKIKRITLNLDHKYDLKKSKIIDIAKDTGEWPNCFYIND